MSSKRPVLDLANAKLTPERIFSAPGEVVTVGGVSKHDKKEILQTWEQNARQLLRAQGEGMAGGEPNQLHAVQKALDDLETT